MMTLVQVPIPTNSSPSQHPHHELTSEAIEYHLNMPFDRVFQEELFILTLSPI